MCRRVKCRVDAFRWNPVEDYNRYFKQRNRFAGKTPLEQRQLLAKAVNRYYHIKWKFNEEEIRKERRKEWIIQKKNNLLSLNLWAHERQKELEDQESEHAHSLDVPEPQSEEIIEVILPNPQREQSWQITESQGEEIEELIEEILPDIQQTQMPQESMEQHVPPPLVLLTQAEEEGESSTSETEESTAAGVQFVISESLDDEVVPEANTEQEIYMEKESVIINSEELRKRGIPNRNVVQMFHVNTDSLTLTSELPESQSITDINGIHSQDVINDYDDFDHGVPQTSTQSQDVNK